MKELRISPLKRATDRNGFPSVRRTTVSALVTCYLMAAVSFVDATESSRAPEIALELLEKTGITEHLSLVSKTIGSEGYDAYSTCLLTDDWKPGATEQKAFEALVNRHFGAKDNQERALQTLLRRLSFQELTAAQAFFDSSLGQRIAEAERASKNFSEDAFADIADEYFESEQWTGARKQLVGEVYKATRAGRFVSIFHGEVTVAISVSAICDASEDNYRTLSDSLKGARSDARFVEPILANDLIFMIATVFRDLSDQELRGYIEFARSNVGQAFFSALLESTRKGISGGLPGVRSERIATDSKRLSSASHED